MGIADQLWTGLLWRGSLTEERPVLLTLLLPRPELLHHAEEQLHRLPVDTLIQINEKVNGQICLCLRSCILEKQLTFRGLRLLSDTDGLLSEVPGIW